MSNRIQHVEVIDRSVTPAEAVLNLVVAPERVAPTTELRGRLMGPRCPYAHTVEVAYSLRPLPGAAGPGTLAARVVIPEPSLWEPVSPFLYQGPVELWEGNECRDQIAVSHGLRRVQVGKRGLLVNGRKIVLHGREVGHCTEAEARAMHGRGTNLWVVSVDETTAPLWDLADRLGFFILGRVASADCRELVRRLDRRASGLGWLVPQVEPFRGCRGLLGAWAAGPAGTGPPPGVQFVACPAEVGAAFNSVPVVLFASHNPQAVSGDSVLGTVWTA